MKQQIRPMIFNTEMVKSLLEGRKTVTRRPVNPQPTDSGDGFDWWPSKYHQSMARVSGLDLVECEKKKEFLKDVISEACPIAKVGDLIYVRETFCHQPCANAPELTVYKAGYPNPELLRKYESVMPENEIKWSPSIHMPRKHSRLTLKVTAVRVEKIQDITEEQAKKEGVRPAVWFAPYKSNEGDWLNFGGEMKSEFKNGFATLWDSIYQDWDKNPYVWVIEFEVIHQNVDKYCNA